MLNELIFALVLLFVFLSLASIEMRSVARASQNNARGATELLVATRFAERFRDDVRQARSVQIEREGSSVLLTEADEEVVYRISTEMRLERVQVKSGDVDSGPFVQTSQYALDETQQRRFLHARWECLAEIDPAQDLIDPARPAPRTLILDTALRAEVAKEPKR